ncbi:MAG: hypothetical protein DDT27_01577 [Dehalococcoidia bacterium]|nr:hypothetical protein [Chloroflexota bacterium]
MRVHWTDNAAEHLLGIMEHFAQRFRLYICEAQMTRVTGD